MHTVPVNSSEGMSCEVWDDMYFGTCGNDRDGFCTADLSFYMS